MEKTFTKIQNLAIENLKQPKKFLITIAGIEVQTGVAKTGVVGILKGGKPGPVVGQI
jgi:hypothetical protein